MSPPHGDGALSAKQRAVLECLFNDPMMDIRQAAERAEAASWSLRRWMNDETFLRELAATEQLRESMLRHRRLVSETAVSSAPPAAPLAPAAPAAIPDRRGPRPPAATPQTPATPPPRTLTRAELDAIHARRREDNP